MKKILITESQLCDIFRLIEDSHSDYIPNERDINSFIRMNAGYPENKPKLKKKLISVQVLELWSGKPEDDKSWKPIKEFNNENNNAYVFAKNWIKKYTFTPKKYKIKPIYQYV